ncbi:cytochrome B [Neisseria meningitidis]|uniref:Cytochrome b561 homolog 2 n=1 Tax=Neisseria meningitidis alpha522 TaxID=996307 RepID=I4E8T8_NEIME|nr:cytochrome b/b6 domain-containing protein [Neisseria meningitidis]ELK94226.1 prokaryotic cytochrome b561 family protein [Neisseria meningitidis 9757]EOC15105.1 prokaryotic cytochrome b561 family protein [Neisseria meningitidis 2002020]EOC16686.1 prokaryotic cytochrome b561 family protein [Neisseria meningitidis NM477]EQD16405.1 prokaryotic cytochrome b561 family protein [Neisseria meningitidis NM3173]CCA45757.1 cytochrome b561 homolog 2 [Neisseria meningitidis alpha522]
MGSLFGLHKSFGFLTLTVITLRIVWAVANRAKRPQSDCKAAAAGHGILYLLMLAVPVIGMIRQYGSGRGPLKVFGVEVMQGFAGKNRVDGKLGQHVPRQFGLAAVCRRRRTRRHGRRPPCSG